MADVGGATPLIALDAVVTVYPADSTGEIARRAPAGFRVIAQRGRNLPERMGWAAAEAGATGAGRILLCYSYSPALGLPHIEASLPARDQPDLVLAPGGRLRVIANGGGVCPNADRLLISMALELGAEAGAAARAMRGRHC